MVTTDVIAHHESGHAVIAVALNLPLEYVTVTPEPETCWLGVTACNPPSTLCTADGGSWEDLMDELAMDRIQRHHIITALAGRITEERYTGTPVRRGSRSDYQNVINGFKRLGVNDRGERARMFRTLRERSTQLVNDRWHDVDMVAIALLDQPRLSGDVVRQMVNRGQGLNIL